MGSLGPLTSGLLQDRTARASQRSEHLPHLIAGRCHDAGPGRVPIRHDPHPREPFPNQGDQPLVRAEGHERVWPLGIDQPERVHLVRSPRGELPLGRRRREPERSKRRLVLGDAEHLDGPTHVYFDSFIPGGISGAYRHCPLTRMLDAERASLTRASEEREADVAAT